MSIESRIKAAITGIAEEKKTLVDGENLITGISPPPSYLVMFVLSGICGFSRYHWEEKSAWQFFITFEGFNYKIRDWKGYSWSIECPEDSDASLKSARKLVRKITSACIILDKGLTPYLQKEISAGNFFIHNVYHKSRRLYETFRQQTLEARRKIEEEYAKSRMQRARKGMGKSGRPIYIKGIKVVPNLERDDFFNKVFRLEGKELDNGTAMIAYYFSYLEFIFDVLFAFKDDMSYDYTEFRQLTWNQRFKYLFKLSSNKELRKIYIELYRIKKICRDVVLHGYGDKSALLVPFSRIGLIPVQYSAFEQSAHYSLFSIRKEDLEIAIDTFLKFDEWLENHDTSFYAIEYAKAGFEIPMAKKEIAKIRDRMTSRDEFIEYLHEKSMFIDYLSEQYEV